MIRHTYKPPKGRSGMSFAVLAGLFATLVVFVVVPLSQKLNDIFQPPTAPPDDSIAVDPPKFEDTTLDDTPPETQPDEEIKEMVEEPAGPDLGFDAADLAVGGGGPIIMVIPKFGSKDAASMMDDQMDTPPQPTAKFPPQYPSSLLQKKITGKVLVACVIDASGKIISTTVRQSSGHRELDQAAVTAVTRWKFKPAQKAGRPAKGSIVVPFNFEIK